MREFNWTPKRDDLLRTLRRQGLSLIETARAIGCEVDHVRLRLGELGEGPRALVRRAPAAVDLKSVPRPAPPPPATRPAGRPALIDLSKAPSLMEERFAPERFR